MTRKERKDILARDIQEALENRQKGAGLRTISDLIDFIEEEFLDAEVYVLAKELNLIDV